MTGVRISAKTRWLCVAASLMLASAIVSHWRPAPDAPRAVVNLPRLVPSMFTAVSAQSIVTDCVANAVTGNKFEISVTEVKVTSGSTDTTVSTLTNTLNVVGQDGDVMAGKFLEGASVPAGSYTAIKPTIGTAVTLKGQITCTSSAWGGGQRTYYTDPNTGSLDSDPCVDDSPGVLPCSATSANPQDVQHTVSVQPNPPTLSVSFTVQDGQTTFLNIGFQNPQLVLYNLGGGVFKIFAGNPQASSVQEAQQ